MGSILAVLVLSVWLVRDVCWAMFSLVIPISAWYVQDVMGGHMAASAFLISIGSAIFFDLWRSFVREEVLKLSKDEYNGTE